MEPAPATTQQAQDAVYRYYQKTLSALPDGFALDNSVFGNHGATVAACDDNAPPNDAPAQLSDYRLIVAPPGTDYPALVVKIGDIWKSWGWRVEEKDGFDKPNRFGYAPDGYRIQIEAAGDKANTYPPGVIGSSPCFPGDKSRYEPIPGARLITRDGIQYDQPSAMPTR